MKTSITTIGVKIKINKGEVETLTQLERPYGLFQSAKYKVVRNIVLIKDNEIVN